MLEITHVQTTRVETSLDDDEIEDVIRDWFVAEAKKRGLNPDPDDVKVSISCGQLASAHIKWEDIRDIPLAAPREG